MLDLVIHLLRLLSAESVLIFGCICHPNAQIAIRTIMKIGEYYKQNLLDRNNFRYHRWIKIKAINNDNTLIRCKVEDSRTPHWYHHELIPVHQFEKFEKWNPNWFWKLLGYK